MEDSPDSPAGVAAGAGTLELEHMRRTLKQRLFRMDVAPLKVGRFVVLDRLGEGAMGVVFSAYDPLLDRKVALKILRAQPGGGGAQQRRRMIREARALARLEHPNSLGIFEAGEHDGAVFLVTAFVRGSTLRVWLQRGPHPIDEVLRVMIAAGRGLAAAHGAQVVHRDFKPENVMLGEDGQVRVLDFGLAALHDRPEPEAQASPDDAGAGLDGDLTRTGARLGTPAYMAPEQRSGGRPDARSDQYSFCAVLYEGLYGERVREPSPGAAAGTASPRVPAWLAAVLARGLEPDPAARWPTMERLLDALAEDPAAARRGRRRALGIAASLVLLGSAAAMALASGASAWSRARSEREADARLVAIEPRVEQQSREGRRGEARELLREFSELAGVRGTAAHARVWLRQAARERAAGDVAGAIESLVEVDVDALDGPERVSTQRGLAEVLRDDHDWTSMAAVLAALDEDELRAHPELRALAVTSAAANRDLARARDLSLPTSAAPQLAALAPLLAALASVTTTEQVAHAALVLDSDGDGARELLLRHAPAGVPGGLSLARADPTLAPSRALGGLSTGLLPLAAVTRAGGPDLVVGWDGEDGVLLSLGPGEPREHLRWREGAVVQATGADLDGDGRREPYVGTGPYSRRLLALREGHAAGWEVVVPHAETRGSDITAMLGADLDGDRVEELIVAVGPWRAYDVRVLRPTGDGAEQQLVARRQLGSVSGLATLGAERPLLVALKGERGANRRIFADDAPTGAPAGVYLLELVDGTLQQRAFLPVPRRLSDRLPLDLVGLRVGDVDGDGLEDLVVHARRLARADEVFQSPLRAHEHALLIYRQLAGLRFEPVLIGGLAPLALVELDGDPAVELIARDSAGDSRTVVLGAGDGTLAPLPGLAEVSAPSPAAEPWIADVQRRAGRLVRLGLRERAGRLLERTAEAVDGDVQAQLRIQAAQLAELDQQYARSAALHELAAGSAAVREVELSAAARDYLRAGSYASAARVAGALAARATGDARRLAEAAELHALARELAAQQPPAAGRFDRPLDPAWRIDDPLALRRAPDESALHVHAFADQATIASLPVEWDARHLSLELEVELVRLEWSAGVLFTLAPEDGAGEPIKIRIFSGGGGGIAEHHVLCELPGGARGKFFVPPGGSTTGQPARRLVIRLDVMPLLGEWSCTLAEPDGRVLRQERGALARRPAPGPRRLEISGLGGRPEDTSAWAEVAVRRLSALGVEVVEAPRTSPLDRLKQALVEGDPAAALRIADVGDVAAAGLATWRVAAQLELGRWHDAESRLGAVIGDAAASRDALHLLRTQRATFVPIVRGRDPAGFPRLFWRAWSAALAHGSDDALADRALLLDVGDVTLAEGRVEAYVLELLLARARALARAGRWGDAEADVAGALRVFTEGRAAGRGLDDGASAELESALWIELAALCVRDGRYDAAQRHVAQALARAEDRFHVNALVRRRAGLARWADPEPS
ncbi:MAG: serine/threonine protein kinase [Myxococcales bacterium]|nr:serine/threonine protein kinase [Myxococcales bacterium]